MMAHNHAVLLVPMDIERDALSEYIQNLFLPFAREFEFPSFVCPCYCNGLEKRIEFANKSTKHFHQYWRSYHTLPKTDRPRWTDYIKDWETALLSYRLGNATFDPGCFTCQGNGYFTSHNYPLNMYDYWHELEGEYLGPVSEVSAELKIVETPLKKQLKLFQLFSPSHKPFMFYHVVTPDGLPYGRWDYASEEQWFETWRTIAQQWRFSYVVSCLVHD
jgi:hypothetical protein